MDKIEALFVRALKSKSPEFRAKRLYCKFYYHEFDYQYLASTLAKIVEKYSLMNTKDWINGLNPQNNWMYGVDVSTSYYEQCVSVMSSFIRLSAINKFDDYPIPAAFK